LVALGIIFSLAYERTGRIGTTIIAHGLFNLNTIILILCGVTT
jgi:membrane protease YdiL (CAAX protease family)